MLTVEIAGIVTALATASRRAVVLSDAPDFRIFASGYNAALADVLTAIREPEQAAAVKREAAKLLGEVRQ